MNPLAGIATLMVLLGIAVQFSLHRQISLIKLSLDPSLLGQGGRGTCWRLLPRWSYARRDGRAWLETQLFVKILPLMIPILGFHMMLPFLTTVRNIQTTLQVNAVYTNHLAIAHLGVFSSVGHA